MFFFVFYTVGVSCVILGVGDLAVFHKGLLFLSDGDILWRFFLAFIISSGVIPPNPSELLNSQNMINLLNELKEKYDIILFDTPPLLAVTDPYILMQHVDYSVIVVRSGFTQKLGLERVLASIRNRGFKETGIVFNGINEQNSYGSGYYYNYYQYYYSDNKS